MVPKFLTFSGAKIRIIFETTMEKCLKYRIVVIIPIQEGFAVMLL